MKVPPTEAEFLAWAKKANWLQIGTKGTPQGRQDIYVTPAGEIAYALYDISGKFVNIGKQVLQAIPQPNLSPLGFKQP